MSDRSLSSVYQFKVSAEIKYLKIVVEITVLFAPKNLFSAMALSLLVPAVLAPKAEAAAKPKLSAKSVKVIVGAKKKVTVKKVKARLLILKVT